MKKYFLIIPTVTMLIAAVVVLFMLCSGCSQKYVDSRNIQRMQSYMPRYQLQASALANQLWPCFSGKAKIDTVIQHDTTVTKGDTTVITKHDTTTITIRLPGKTITNTLKIHDTIPDTRKEAQLQLQLKASNDSMLAAKNAQIKAQQQYQDAQATSRHRFWRIVGLAGIIIIYLAIKTYLFFSGGAVANTAGSILKKL